MDRRNSGDRMGFRRLKRVDLSLVQLQTTKQPAPLGNGLGQKRNGRSYSLVFRIIGKADHLHPRFEIGLATP